MLIGQTVDVIEENNLLRIFESEKEIALHKIISNKKGNFITDKKHYPSNKNISSEEILSRQKIEMNNIGSDAIDFYDIYLKNKVQNRKYDYRTISGILSLRKKYSNEIINNACKRAIHFNSLSFKTVKNICEKGILIDELPAESYVNSKPTDISRNLNVYNKFLFLGGIHNE